MRQSSPSDCGVCCGTARWSAEFMGPSTRWPVLRWAQPGGTTRIFSDTTPAPCASPTPWSKHIWGTPRWAARRLEVWPIAWQSSASHSDLIRGLGLSREPWRRQRRGRPHRRWEAPCALVLRWTAASVGTAAFSAGSSSMGHVRRAYQNSWRDPCNGIVDQAMLGGAPPLRDCTPKVWVRSAWSWQSHSRASSGAGGGARGFARSVVDRALDSVGYLGGNTAVAV